MTFPFIVWPHQADAVREIYRDRVTGEPRLGFDDTVVEKSRGEGMSWMGILFALHWWLFEPYSKIGLVSRTEEAADDPEDSDSLFWKIDWELTQLPLWMAGRRGPDWKRVVDRHTLTNKRNGAMIKASAATGDVFRGGRLTWALMDEFAFFKKKEDADALNASHGATDSRLFVSTVNGQHNEYHRIAHDPSTYKVIIDWKQNVSRNRGLYKFEKGVPVAIDPGEQSASCPLRSAELGSARFVFGITEEGIQAGGALAVALVRQGVQPAGDDTEADSPGA